MSKVHLTPSISRLLALQQDSLDRVDRPLLVAGLTRATLQVLPSTLERCEPCVARLGKAQIQNEKGSSRWILINSTPRKAENRQWIYHSGMLCARSCDRWPS